MCDLDLLYFMRRFVPKKGAYCQKVFTVEDQHEDGQSNAGPVVAAEEVTVQCRDAGAGDKSHHLSADNCCDTNTGRGNNCGMVEM